MSRARGFAWIAFAVLAACGGGGSGNDTLALPSEAALDGSVRSNGTVLTGLDVGGVFTGDRDSAEPGVGSRQLLSFSLGAIPSGATIESATLQVFQEDPDGIAFANHGVVVVDHLAYGAALDAGDFALAALTSDVGTLSTDGSAGLRFLDVTSEVVADLAAARTRSQFRLRFSLFDTDNDGLSDNVHFRDADTAGVGDPPPVLVVVFDP